jgi:hypothetical protein
MFPDQEAVQSFGARTSLDLRPRGNDDATAGEPLVFRALDDIEGKAERTIGTADGFWRQPLDPSADLVQTTAPFVVEHEDAPITRSLDARAVLVGVMVVVALGLGEFLMRRSSRSTADGFWSEPLDPFADVVTPPPFIEHTGAPTTDLRPVELSWRAPDQAAADPSAGASGLQSVQKVLDTIKEVEAEMTCSRQLRTR